MISPVELDVLLSRMRNVQFAAEVYYYQNDTGSRVFFDEIGWPWPKHPCADNQFRILGRALQPKSKNDQTHALNEMQSVGLNLDQSFADKFGHLPWRLLRIVQLFRSGTLNLVIAESLERSRRSSFRFESRRREFNKGDIVAKKGQRVTFVDRLSLEPRKIKVTAIRKLKDFIDAFTSA